QMEKEEETREILLPNWQGSGSHGITIDQTDDGVFVKQVQQNSPAAKMGVVKEGDQIVSATVYFDNLQSGEVAQLLNSMGHHTVGLRLQRRGDKSPLPGQSWSHEVLAASSSESGDDEEYRRIYTTKIKPRLKSEEVVEGECGGTQSRTITVTRKVTAYTVDVTRHDGAKDVDVVGPDFHIQLPAQEISPTTKSDGEAEPGPTTIKMAPGGSAQATGWSVPGAGSWGLHGSSPRIEANGQMGSPDAGFHLKGLRLDGQGHVSGVGVHGELLGGTPSHTAASGPCLQGGGQAPGVAAASPPMTQPDVDVGKIKFPALKVPKFGFLPQGEVGGHAPQMGLTTPRADVTTSAGHLTGPELPAPSVKGPTAQVDAGLKGAVKVSSPELVVPGVAVKGEWKGPTFKKVEPPQISLSDVNLHLKGPQVKGDAGVTGPRVEGDLKGLGSKGLQVDLKAPTVEFEGPEGHLKGPSVCAPAVDVTVKGPQLKGDVDVS
ncbi:AHNK protein, partial [Eurystomus gularis]|nr:AHNK protein [Eurystomus gularis]